MAGREGGHIIVVHSGLREGRTSDWLSLTMSSLPAKLADKRARGDIVPGPSVLWVGTVVYVLLDHEACCVPLGVRNQDITAISIGHGWMVVLGAKVVVGDSRGHLYRLTLLIQAASELY